MMKYSIAFIILIKIKTIYSILFNLNFLFIEQFNITIVLFV